MERLRRDADEARAAVTPATRRRGPRSVRSMLWSVLPLTAVVVAAVLFVSPHRHRVPTVNPTADFGYASRLMGRPVPRPAGLPAGWRSTSSQVTANAGSAGPVSIRVGYLIAGNSYAQLYESNRTRAATASDQLHGASRTGQVRVAGRDWARYRTTVRDQTALLGSVGPVRVVVTGSASLTELRTLAGSLR